MEPDHKNSKTEWKRSQRIIFRIVFVFFILQAVPLDWKYYYHIFRIQWASFNYRDLFYLARYTPQFSKWWPVANSWGFSTIFDWGIIFIVSLAGAAAWSVFGKKSKSYPDLYYLLRTILRYRLSIAVIAYGFIKWFPLQQPYPSLSLLNTNYGELSDWKVLSLSYGVAASLQSFLGAVEILAGILLLFRKSASIGASIVIGFTGNVLLSHFAYGGGEWLYCFYLLGMATVIVWYDALRWFNLLVLRKPTQPNKFHPGFYYGWKGEARYIVKAAMLAFIIPLFGILAYTLYKEGPYQYPSKKGLPDVAGLYNVSVFKINGKVLPYSLYDSTRWQNVVFETWNTMSVRSNESLVADRKNTEELYLNNEERDFESTESFGRHFYSYSIDSSNQTLLFKNKNSHYANDKIQMHYSYESPGKLLLEGKNVKGDAIEVVLDRVDKEYLLNESVEIPVQRSVFKQW